MTCGKLAAWTISESDEGLSAVVPGINVSDVIENDPIVNLRIKAKDLIRVKTDNAFYSAGVTLDGNGQAMMVVADWGNATLSLAPYVETELSASRMDCRRTD